MQSVVVSDEGFNLEITSIYGHSGVGNRILFVDDNIEYKIQRIKKPEYGIL